MLLITLSWTIPSMMRSKAYKALNAAMIEGDIEGKFEVNYISTDEFWD